MAFAVVHFLVTDDVSVASSQWLNSDKTTCMWPPYKELVKVKRAVLEHKKPESTWISYEVVVIGTYPNYACAEISCRRALDTSSLDTELDSETVKLKKDISNWDLSKSSDDGSLSSTVRIIHTSSEALSLKDNSTIQHTLDESGSAFERQVLKQMERTDMILKQQTTMLSNILSLQKKQNDVCSPDDGCPTLPLKSLEDMQDFEDFIESSENFKKTIRYLSAKGGISVSSVTRKTLKTIMSYQLASKFNWAGRGDKKAFKETKTSRLVICAIRENKYCKNAEENDIEENIKLFLKYSPLRIKQIKNKFVSLDQKLGII